MKTYLKYIFLTIFSIILSCRATRIQDFPPEEFLYNADAPGPKFEITFISGKSHNHPLMAIWAEDEKGNFVQTLYVSESIGKGVFKRGDASTGRWLPGELRRPAALPYWSHRRGIGAEDGQFIPDPGDPVPDAYTGPTPKGDFIIRVRLDSTKMRKMTLYFEINQSWDWNEYWTNNKFPDDEEYKTSCQPALVYSAYLDLDSPDAEYEFTVIGHSHYSGKTGELFSDLSTITTALDMTKSITVRVIN